MGRTGQRRKPSKPAAEAGNTAARKETAARPERQKKKPSSPSRQRRSTQRMLEYQQLKAAAAAHASNEALSSLARSQPGLSQPGMVGAQHSDRVSKGTVDTTMPDAVDGVTGCAATHNLQYFLLQAVRRLRWQRMSNFHFDYMYLCAADDPFHGPEPVLGPFVMA